MSCAYGREPCHAALPWLSAYAKSPAAITSCPGLQQAKVVKTDKSCRYTGTGGGGLATADFFAPAIRPSNPPPPSWHGARMLPTQKPLHATHPKTVACHRRTSQ